jgi:hypothetical protein
LADTVMEKGVSSEMKAASRVSDCLPDPPTPTSRAWPAVDETMRTIRHTCLMASSKSTRFISIRFSL